MGVGKVFEMKPDYEVDGIRLFNCDCMDFMKESHEGQFELAIVDPPYGENYADRLARESGKKYKGSVAGFNHYKRNLWDNNIPDETYFKELIRISKHQIIWGYNFLADNLGYCKSPICWDKKRTFEQFADFELAYSSLSKASKIFSFQWNGMLQGDMKNKENRIHPTQKPVQLYKWLLTNYAKKGDKIFDSHGGSFSLAIACLDLGFEFWGCEIDKEYFDSAVKRIETHRQQRIIRWE